MRARTHILSLPLSDTHILSLSLWHTQIRHTQIKRNTNGHARLYDMIGLMSRAQMPV